MTSMQQSQNYCYQDVLLGLELELQSNLILLVEVSYGIEVLPLLKAFNVPAA